MSDLDDLMTRIDEINAKSAADLASTDIDALIAYHRRNRARKASGEKIGDQPKVDLRALLKLKAEPAAKITRRI